jgi:hypothetical protein
VLSLHAVLFGELVCFTFARLALKYCTLPYLSLRHGLLFVQAAAYQVFGLGPPTPARPYIQGLLDPCTNSMVAPNIPAEKLYDKQAGFYFQAWWNLHVPCPNDDFRSTFTLLEKAFHWSCRGATSSEVLPKKLPSIGGVAVLNTYRGIWGKPGPGVLRFQQWLCQQVAL